MRTPLDPELINLSRDALTVLQHLVECEDAMRDPRTEQRPDGMSLLDWHCALDELIEYGLIEPIPEGDA